MATDQYMQNVVPTGVRNNALQTIEWYATKRGGFDTDYVTLPAPNNTTVTALGANAAFNAAMGQTAILSNAVRTLTNQSVYVNSTRAGSVSGDYRGARFTDGFFGGIGYAMITAGGGYFLPSNTMTSFTFTASSQSGSPTLSNISGGFDRMYVGQLLTANVITSASYISSFSAAASTVTMTASAASNSSAATITREGLAKIIDSNYPVDVAGNLVELDGYGYAMDLDGVIHESDQNDLASWPSAAIVPANLFNDRGATVARYRDFVLAFGAQSCEFFYNGGNDVGSVLKRQDNLTFRIGIGASFGENGVNAAPERFIDQVGDYLFFCGSTQGQGQPIYVLEGYAPRKITTPEIETLLGTIVKIHAFQAWGLTVLAVRASINMMYFLEADQWIVNTWDDNVVSANLTWSSVNFAGVDNALYTTASSNAGKILKLNNSSFQDDGAAFTGTWVTSPRVLNGGLRFRVLKAQLIADREASGSATLEVSRNDYSSFQTVGTFDLTNEPMYIHRLGMFQGRVILRLTHNADTTFRPQAIILFWEPCKS